MPPKLFLLQGLTASTHLEALQTLLARPDLDRVLISVAFVTKGGVDLIASKLKATKCRVDVFAGVRNGVTTREGLLALMSAGASVHYVDMGARGLLFHPKIYICQCKPRSGVIIGSANLTMGGLHNNIESSVILDLDLERDEDREFNRSIFAEFDRLRSDYPKNVVRVSRRKEIDDLHSLGRVVTEASSSLPRGPMGITGGTDDIPRISLKVPPLRRRVSPPQTTPTLPSTVPAADPPDLSSDLDLVWESKALTERDLGIPSGKNTHATGSINLDKGLLDPSVDHRHYFRDEVFTALDWGPTDHSTVEEAYARFRLIVKGIERGEFRLRIGHTTSTTTKSYLQRNAMTRMSWGPTKEFVASKDLVGRTMTLYRDKADRTRFVVEID